MPSPANTNHSFRIGERGSFSYAGHKIDRAEPFYVDDERRVVVMAGYHSIRPARVSDAESICRIFAESIRALARAFYSSEQIDAWSRRLTPSRCAAWAEQGGLYVTERGGEIAGFGCIDLADACIDMLYVSPDHARHGVGAALIRYLEDRARDCGIKELHLRASLNAVPFYKAMGYAEVERIIHGSDDGITFECVNMSKRIEENDGL